MKERIIISLTTWSKRIANIPVVLDTIFSQTLPPDKVVINLSIDEQIPLDVQDYITKHFIEVNRVPDTKVYKKLIPTLKKYPNDCIISIDDDWLYPDEMIADFMEAHRLYPNNPISGNREIYFNMQCHCGCASLMKAAFLGSYLDLIDEEIYANCPSDDMTYTYFANKSGYPYMRTKGMYFTNMRSYNNCNSYTISMTCTNSDGIRETYFYLVEKYGNLVGFISLYVKDNTICNIINDIYNQNIIKSRIKGHKEIYSTKSYRIGNAILKPFCYLKYLFIKKDE